MAEVRKRNVNVKNVVKVKNSGGNSAYILAMIGAAVYYIQQADGFGEVIVALLKALVWPAFLVYDLLRLVSI